MRQGNKASRTSQGPEKNRKIVRPRCLDGIATTDKVKMASTNSFVPWKHGHNVATELSRAQLWTWVPVLQGKSENLVFTYQCLITLCRRSQPDLKFVYWQLCDKTGELTGVADNETPVCLVVSVMLPEPPLFFGWSREKRGGSGSSSRSDLY